MFLRVANRHMGRITIQASVEDEDYFRLGDRFTVELIDNTVLIEKSPDGESICRIPTSYNCGSYTRSISSKVADRGLPSFCVDEAEFEIDGELLLWPVPAFYKLAWTQRGTDADCVRRNLSLRIQAAVRDGVPRESVVRAVPAWARGILPAKEWMEIVQQTV